MKPRPFIGLLILDVINRFIFGHWVVIYYVSDKFSFVYNKMVSLCITEPHRDETNKMTCAPNKDSDQPGHLPCLIIESSLCAQWVGKDSRFVHADNEDSDQTGQLPRMI